MRPLIQSLVKRKNNILSVYFTAVYHALEDTLEIVKNLDAAGVDLIEIGMPFQTRWQTVREYRKAVSRPSKMV